MLKRVSIDTSVPSSAGDVPKGVATPDCDRIPGCEHEPLTLMFI